MRLIKGRPRRVLLEDIAKAAGVSRSTVCRALNGNSRVAASTREKVGKIAKEMGYVPDPALSALSVYRWGDSRPRKSVVSIAYVRIAGRKPTTQVRSVNERRAALLRGIEERVADLGIRIENHLLEDYESADRLATVLRARGVDGILFSVEGPVKPWSFDWSPFSVVVLEHDHRDHRLHCVSNDWWSAARELGYRLRGRGYRKLGVCCFDHGNEELNERIFSALFQLRAEYEREQGPQPRIFRYPAAPGSNPENFVDRIDLEFAEFRKWFEEEEPDLVVDDMKYAGLWLERLGVAVPETVGLVSLRAGYEQCCGKSVSGMVQERQRLGRWAVDLLSNLIQQNLKGVPDLPIRLSVPSTWLEGETARGIRKTI